jgi:hypothetical protein
MLGLGEAPTLTVFLEWIKAVVVLVLLDLIILRRGAVEEASKFNL